MALADTKLLALKPKAKPYEVADVRRLHVERPHLLSANVDVSDNEVE